MLSAASEDRVVAIMGDLKDGDMPVVILHFIPGVGVALDSSEELFLVALTSRNKSLRRIDSQSGTVSIFAHETKSVYSTGTMSVENSNMRLWLRKKSRCGGRLFLFLPENTFFCIVEEFSPHLARHH